MIRNTGIFLNKRKPIKITHIEDPYTFWFKYTDEDDRELQTELLETDITRYSIGFMNISKQFHFEHGDIVSALLQQDNCNKWIRARIERIDDSTAIKKFHIWSYDHGCEFCVESNRLVPLLMEKLATKPIANNFIGGLSHIVPAKMELNTETLNVELVKQSNWTEDDAQKLNDIICDANELIFEEQFTVEGRHIGRLYTYAKTNTKKEIYINRLLYVLNRAIETDDFLDDVKSLDINHFIRGHPESNSKTEIMTNTDELNNGATGITDEYGHFDEGPQSSISQNDAENRSSSSSLSLNMFRMESKSVAIVSDDNGIIPTEKWNDAFYFPDNIRKYVKGIAHDIDTTRAHGWPHIMRSNSLILIGDKTNGKITCLPTIFTSVLEQPDDCNSLEPLAIVFASNNNNAMFLTKQFQRLMEKSNTKPLNIICVNSNVDAREHLKDLNSPIDILVATPFCFDEILKRLPRLFQSKRFQLVWFDEMDEMCKNNEAIVNSVVDVLYSHVNDIQILVTSKSYCAILKMIFESDKTRAPMLLIENCSSFDANLFANTEFFSQLISDNDADKSSDLISKLHSMTGSIVIFCESQDEVKNLSTLLLQSDIKNYALRDTTVKDKKNLEKWAEESLKETRFTQRNILVCHDEFFRLHSIHTAQHIIHYSFPKTLELFLMRYQSTLGFSEVTLNDSFKMLIENIPNRKRKFHVTVSIAYFDFKQSNSSLEIYDFLSKRAQCLFPAILTDTIVKITNAMESEKRLRPMCMQLITKAANCSTNCAYRHSINFDDNYLPKSGDIKMRLLEVLAPNRYSIHITHYRYSGKGKWFEFSNQDKWDKFNGQLNEFYHDVNNHIKHLHCDLDDMCAVFKKNEIFRGRVMEKKNQTIKVLLFDIGKMEKCDANALLKLDEQFCDFPVQTIEAILLGIEPNDFHAWKSDAKRCVSEWTKNERNEMFAKIVNAFERTLLIEKLEIHRTENNIKIGSNLIKHGYAAKTSINLHPCFANTETNYTSRFASAQSIENENVAVAHPSTAKIHNLSNLIAYRCGAMVPNKLNNVFGNVQSNLESGIFDDVPSNSTKNSPAPIHEKLSAISRESNSPILKSAKEVELANYLAESKNRSSSSSHSDAMRKPVVDVDAIFNITSDIQVMKPLIPYKANKEENLIDLDDVATTSNFNVPSPFNNYRVIKSFDDLL